MKKLCQLIVDRHIPQEILDKETISVLFSHRYSIRQSWSGIITKLKPLELWNIVCDLQVVISSIDRDDEVTEQIAIYVLCQWFDSIPVRERPERYDLDLDFYENWAIGQVKSDFTFGTNCDCENLINEEIRAKISLMVNGYLRHYGSE